MSVKYKRKANKMVKEIKYIFGASRIEAKHHLFDDLYNTLADIFNDILCGDLISDDAYEFFNTSEDEIDVIQKLSKTETDADEKFEIKINKAWEENSDEDILEFVEQYKIFRISEFRGF